MADFLLGMLPTGLMLMGLAYNIFLCFNQSLFRASNSKGVAINAIKTLIQIVCDVSIRSNLGIFVTWSCDLAFGRASN